MKPTWTDMQGQALPIAHTYHATTMRDVQMTHAQQTNESAVTGSVN